MSALFAAPLAFGAVPPWAWASLSYGVVVVLVLWAAGSLRERVLRIYFSPAHLLGVLFLFLGAVQYFSHLTFDLIATREALLKLATDLLLFFLAGQLLASAPDRIWRGFGLAVVLYSLALGMFSILQFFTSQNLIYWVVKSRGYTFGPYVNHNHYAGLMEMLIPVGLGYALLGSRTHPSQVLIGFASLVPIASLLLSGSRGGFVSLITEILILAIVISRGLPLPGRKTLATLGVLGTIAAASLFLWMDPGRVSRRLETVAGLAHSPEVTFGDRWLVTQDAFHLFRDHLVVGTGLGSFETVYPQYRSFPSDAEWDHAHNDYVEALAETGLLGGIVILIALMLFFWLGFRNLRERLKRERGCIQLGAAIGCAGLLVHSFVDFNLHIPANAAWFVFLAAVATIDGNQTPQTRAADRTGLERAAQEPSEPSTFQDPRGLHNRDQSG